MNIDSRTIISVTDANQNFSRVTKIVKENGQAVIFKNNKPKYMMLDINNTQAIDKAYTQMKEWNEETKPKGAR